MNQETVTSLIYRKEAIVDAGGDKTSATLTLTCLVEKDGKYEAKVKSSNNGTYRNGRGIANVKEDAVKRAAMQALGL